MAVRRWACPPTPSATREGASGEFLDVFGFGKFDIGDIPVNVKLGQTTVFWGESLLLNGAIHSVAYSQNPLDVWKGLATPGAEAKELFRPRVGLKVQAQVAAGRVGDGPVLLQLAALQQPGVSLSGVGLVSVDRRQLAVGRRVADPRMPPARSGSGAAPTSRRNENTGNWGLAAKWSPEWLDGTLGGYYRRTYDMQPQAMATPARSAGTRQRRARRAAASRSGRHLCFVNPNATSLSQLQQFGKVGEYNAAYGDDIDIFGVSLSKNIAGVSVGAELSYRRNMPLLSEPVFVLPAAFVPLVPGSIATTALPDGDTPGAQGNTMHGLVNALGIINKTPVFDTAAWNAELTWMTWLDVTQNEAVFKGREQRHSG